MNPRKIVAAISVLLCLAVFLCSCSANIENSTGDRTNNGNGRTESGKSPSNDNPITQDSTNLNLSVIAEDNVYTIAHGLQITSGNVLQGHSSYSFKEWNGKDIDSNVRSIESNSGATALYIKEDCSLWGFGSNEHGRLGDGTGVDKDTPVKIMDDVACVFETSYGYTNGFHAIKTDKSLWEWGHGENYAPVKVADNVVNIIEIIGDGVCYYMHLSTGHIVPLEEGKQSKFMCLEADMPVYEFYYNNSAYSAYWIDLNRVLWNASLNAEEMAKSNVVWVSVEVSENIESILSVDSSAVLFKKLDGSLWGYGDNTRGALGDGTKVPRDEAVKITDDVAEAEPYRYLKSNGELWAWDISNPTPEKIREDVACIWVMHFETDPTQYLRMPQKHIFS